MMSLSDEPSGRFEPLSVSTLETFDDEQTTADDTTAPDFDRFSLLIEKPAFDKEGPVSFETLIKVQEEIEPVYFKPLIEPEEPVDPPAGQAEPGEETAAPVEEEPEETPEEKGFKIGYEEGLAQGLEQGKAKGYDEGYQTGEEKGLAEGEQKGFAQGEQKGLAQGEAAGEAKAMEEGSLKSQEILESLETALNKADQTLEKLVSVYEDRIIDLIEKIASRAVMARIEIDPEAVRPLVLEALENLVEPEHVTLNISVDDYEYIEMIKDTFFEQVESLKTVSVRSDPGISRGSCRIDTKAASVSNDIESRLEAIFEAMKKAGGE